MKSVLKNIFLLIRAVALEIVLAVILCVIFGIAFGHLGAALLLVVSLKSLIPVNTVFLAICFFTGYCRNLVASVKTLIVELVVFNLLTFIISIFFDMMKIGLGNYSTEFVALVACLLISLAIYSKKNAKG